MNWANSLNHRVTVKINLKKNTHTIFSNKQISNSVQKIPHALYSWWITVSYYWRVWMKVDIIQIIVFNIYYILYSSII